MSERDDLPIGRDISSDVKKAVGLALTGFAGLVLLAVLIAVLRGDSDESPPAVQLVLFFIVGVTAYGLMIVGGILAAIALRSGEMESGSGRMAVRLAVALAVVLPVMALIFGLLALTNTWEGDSEPFLGTWVALALIASLIGVFAPEPGRRGLLVFPLLVGVAAVVLLISEFTGLT